MNGAGQSGLALHIFVTDLPKQSVGIGNDRA